MQRSHLSNRGQRLSPLAIPVIALGILALVLVAVRLTRSGSDTPQPAPAQPTITALSTQVASQQAQLAGRATEVARQQDQIARQQRLIAQLQRTATASRTPVSGSDGLHTYTASFQIDRYTYVLYMQWDESSGFIHDGQIRTDDNYAAKAARSFRFTGVDNGGSYGFTGSDSGASMIFTGTANKDGTFAVAGLPWSVFSGFLGGTFTQTLHPGSLADYTAAAANLARPAR